METARVRLRQMDRGDAQFVLSVLTDPSVARNIGDRGVRTLEQAAAYIDERIVDSYSRHGFGIWAVERRADGVVVGMSGLVKREELDDVDIGFAFLPEYRGCGYALESAQAVCRYSFDDLRLQRLVAITLPNNRPSIAVLEKLGFHVVGNIRFDDEGEDLRLYVREGHC
jgi:RimJ/RimL family protein N-acetyltransferase